MRVAINGFGRIGRMVFRANLMNPKIDIVAVNDGDPCKPRTQVRFQLFNFAHGY
jgi:glyceraldehyde 3-phosphate dehydrogenase